MLVGSTISHYKIVEKLGEGGMGVVYKAEDTKLDRTVALKFLAQHLLNDEEAKERFLREAKAAAALDHPNICTVYEIGEADGKTFISMAFIEGDTLESRIAEGPLPIKDALEIARQIADGLQAAHEKAVVHRDIKPANVVVDGNGRATIMDFGLARLTEASRLTKVDTAMGTVAYMSPEQAQGMEVDSRSDLWSLGCVLYEMVTGLRPFKGEYDQALLYEIVHEEPAPLTSVRAGVPMELEFIVGKCLAKDRDDRHQAAKEIAVDLRTLAEKLKSGRSTILRTASPTETVPAAAMQAVPSSTRHTSKTWLTASVIAVVAIAGWAGYLLRPAPAPDREMRFSVSPPEGATLIRIGGQGGYPILSPDGSQLLLSTSKGGFLRYLGSLDPVLLSSDGLRGHTSFSPDGHWVVRVGADSIEKRMLPDGAWQRLADSSISRGISWGSRGWILVSSGGGLQAVPKDGGEPIPVLGRWGSRLWPQFLPDGEHFIFGGIEEGSDEWGIYLSRLGPDGGADTPVLLLVNPGSAKFSPVAGGRLFFVQGSRLYARKLDVGTRSLMGEPQPVADNVAQSPTYALSHFDVAEDGTLAWRPGSSSQSQLTWFDRRGLRFETVGPASAFIMVSLSPDGQRVVSAGTGGLRYAPRNFLLLESSQSGSRDLGGQSFYQWGMDSNSLLTIVASDQGQVQLVQQAALPGAEQRVLSELPRPLRLLDVSEDGRSLIVVTGPQSPFIYDLDNPGVLTPIGTAEDIFSAGWSPDGQWLVFVTANHVYVQSRDLTSARHQISGPGGRYPVWRGDGREILYVEDGKMMSVAVDTRGGQFRAAAPEELFEVQLAPYLVMGSKPFDVTADGSRILIEIPEEQPGSDVVNIATGWQASLE